MYFPAVAVHLIKLYFRHLAVWLINIWPNMCIFLMCACHVNFLQNVGHIWFMVKRLIFSVCFH